MKAAASGSRPPAAAFLPGRVFYGWYVAIACGVLMFVGVGVGYYGLPVFLTPLREEHGWSTTQVSWAPTIYFLVAGITSALIGPFIDRKGPMQFLIWGTLANGILGAMIGLVDQLWQLYAVYFVFAVAFGLSSGIAVNAIMTRWFVRRRALAMSISSTGVSLGGVVISPLASWLIDIGGLELATPILGGLVLLAGMPVVLLVISWTPDRMGLRPDGDLEPPDRTRETETQRAQHVFWTRKQAASTVAFWAIMGAFLLVLIAQTGYIIHQVSFLEDRLGSRGEAAFTISVTALGSIIARLAVGIFADNVDRRLLSAALFVIQATCVLLIIHTENVAATWVLTLIFGFTIGNVYMMQSLIVGEIFGMVSFATVFGLISFAGQAGSSLGPLGVGILYDVDGGYTLPFTVTAILTYIAAGLILLARPAKVPRPEPSPAAADAVTAPGGGGS